MNISIDGLERLVEATLAATLNDLLDVDNDSMHKFIQMARAGNWAGAETRAVARII